MAALLIAGHGGANGPCPGAYTPVARYAPLREVAFREGGPQVLTAWCPACQAWRPLQPGTR